MNGNVKNPWPGPAGMIPVADGRADDANAFDRNYLGSIHMEMRVIDTTEPISGTIISGEEFDPPIMMSAFLHLNKVLKDDKKPMLEYARTAKKLNTVSWVGMEPNEKYAGTVAGGTKTVRIIEPFANHNTTLNEIQFAIKHGAIAVSVDIGHIPGTDGRYDVVDGIPLSPAMLSDLKGYVEAAGSVPLVVEGVLSIQDTLKRKEVGYAVIVISHHHGRILFGVAPVMVLPRVKATLEGSGIAIFINCSIDTSYNAYKAPTLGASAVAVGREIPKPLLQQGAEGIEEEVQKMNK